MNISNDIYIKRIESYFNGMVKYCFDIIYFETLQRISKRDIPKWDMDIKRCYYMLHFSSISNFDLVEDLVSNTLKHKT